MVIYKKPYLNASVKENYVTISAESDRKTLIFPKQLPEFIQLLNALNPYLQPESISILIQQKEKNIPQWYSFLKEKKLFQPYTVGEHEVGLLCCGKEIRIECFPYSNQWLFTLNHIKSPIVRKLGEGFPMNTEVIKKAISWLCELFLKFHKEK
ncbi:MAG TPA: hypothetical protein ENF67_00255 [Candidatus Pacearchaeota archaeon]|nr:hypothetical protein [Candidatus Pacearchaeota archaeon]